MSKFLFISDFDGTISREDFYKKIMNKYMPEKAKSLYVQFKAGEILDIDFLNNIFTTMNLSKEELEKEILDLEIDPTFFEALQLIKQMGGDIIILSAGSEYYIKKIFHQHGLSDIPIYSSEGIYKDRGLHITPNVDSDFYSPRYGIDKEKVVQHFKAQYDYIMYAGDSAPDYKASLLADLRFAKDELIPLYDKAGEKYIPMKSFKDVISYLNQKNWK